MSEIKRIRERFKSGNNVPVPDIRLSRKEWEAVESALAQARAEERERCKREIKMVLSNNRLTSTAWPGTFSDGWNAAMDEILQPLMHSIRALSDEGE